MRRLIFILIVLLFVACVSRPPLRLGMSRDEVRASRGIPNRVNRTVTEHGVVSQWGYRRGFNRWRRSEYLYFDRRGLVAWQD